VHYDKLFSTVPELHCYIDEYTNEMQLLKPKKNENEKHMSNYN